MSEYQIIRFCAPTLAGLKTASLFCCDAPDEAELLGQLRHWNTSLAPKGLRMLPLRIWNGRALIYLYRPKALARDLACEDAACLLNGSGYDGTEPSGCLRCLMDRLQCQKDGFPHEIGSPLLIQGSYTSGHDRSPSGQQHGCRKGHFHLLHMFLFHNGSLLRLTASLRWSLLLLLLFFLSNLSLPAYCKDTLVGFRVSFTFLI